MMPTGKFKDLKLSTPVQITFVLRNLMLESERLALIQDLKDKRSSFNGWHRRKNLGSFAKFSKLT